MHRWKTLSSWLPWMLLAVAVANGHLPPGTALGMPPELIRVPRWAQVDEGVVQEFLHAKRLEDVSPRGLFLDFMLVDDEALRARLERHCVANGATPTFTRDSQLGWVWQKIVLPGSPPRTLDRRDEVAKFKRALRYGHDAKPSERELEEALADYLSASGASPRRQVPCAGGLIDILTADAVYELKVDRGRSSFFQAVGQVLLYRAAVGPALRAVIAIPEHVASREADLIGLAESIGIETVTLEWVDSGFSVGPSRGGVA
jgi:hypothetical protein